MAQTIATLKDNLQRKLHGTSLNKVSSVNTLIGEAAGNVLAEINPKETVRIAQITNAIYDQVYNYPAPTDLKGNKIIDLRPQVNRGVSDVFAQRLAREFDQYKNNNTFQVKFDGGTRSLRIAKELTNPITIDQVSGITDNGSWAVGGDGTNLTKDTVTKISGNASLNFDVSGATTEATIENSTLTQIDLTDHDEQSKLFAWVFLPSGTATTSINLRWGNDSSNYWNRSVTTQQDGTAFQTGWNLLGFDWNGATEVGTVAPATIDYLRLAFTYDGTADTDFRIDTISSALGSIFDIEYYSKYLFQNSSGTYLEAPTDDTDTINLDTDSYNILLYETAYLLGQELQGEDATFDAGFFANEKNRLLNLYRKNNPSESITPQSFYYRMK